MADQSLLGHEDDFDELFGTGSLRLERVQAISSGTVKSMKLKMSSGPGSIYVGIYSDVGSEPSALLSTSSLSSYISGWNTIPVQELSIIKDNYYWLAVVCTTQTAYGDLSGGYSRRKTYTFGALPNPAGGGFTTSTVRYSMCGYGSTPSGGVGLLGPSLVGPSPLLGKSPLISW